jgi:putative glutamine amidotransferase
MLARIAGTTQLRVNSLHWQGVDRLGAGLAVEARAPDGLIEAFRVDNAVGFALGLQWHPEWQFEVNPFSSALFASFGTACSRRASSR